ncbi:transposase is4 family protein [Leptolyngbya sp. Heron Island J]|uniref:IS5 family transposase n=1 Tax=Leptolyngbya sp. Heron Island J TaxID=1385935 RepID=UPI0003B9B86F|nr:IS5 family transposase [Leptolyngbya sp. Heron Island J]ESA38730.1 transposase is4 family protein [Leptolyngbya sp. Heron Island J]
MPRLSYPSDLSDDEWDLIKPLIPVHQGVGHPQEVNLREIVNAILYWADNGIKWRAMPHDLPNWSTVYDYYRRWVKIGLWDQMNEHLVKLVRLAEGRDEQPSLTSIDSQSVRTSEKKGPDQGIDGHKCVKGRKRHTVVDILGMVLNCFVSAANMADIKAAVAVLEPVLEAYVRLEKVLADQAYNRNLRRADRTRSSSYSRSHNKTRRGVCPCSISMGRREHPTTMPSSASS